MSLHRVKNRLDELYSLGAQADGGTCRLAYSAAEAQAMLLVARWLEEAGLEPVRDQYGNLWGLPPGEDGSMVTSGSHVDTVPRAGKFDGALGTILAIECAEKLSGPYGVLVCAAEEGPRFGAGTIGSRSLVEKLTGKDLQELRDPEGKSANEARGEFLDLLPGIPALAGPALLSRVTGHVEVHIEQRRSLKDKGAALGIATAVAGPVRYNFRFTGATGHSGETPPETRRDALCSASETVLLAEQLAKEASATVATVATVQVSPNSLTAIPGSVTLGVDMRGTKEEEIEQVRSRLISGSSNAANKRGVEFTADLLSCAAPTTLDSSLVSLAEGVCRDLGIQSSRCTSMAGHDVQHLSERIPAALLFVPSTNGVSHAPGEEVDWRDVESTLDVLVALLPKLLQVGRAT